MWEMLETFVMWCRHKKWPVPFGLFAALIVLILVLSFVGEQNSQKPTFIPTAIVKVTPSPTMTISPAPTPIPVMSPILFQKKEHNHEAPPQPEASPVGSNIMHAKDAVTDALKVEGINREVSDQIFHQLREQIKKPEDEAMPLAVIVRQVLGPNVSDEEVFRITDIMSQALKDSFDYVQSR